MKKGLWNSDKYKFNVLCERCTKCKSIIPQPNRDRIGLLVKCKVKGILKDQFVKQCSEFIEEAPEQQLNYFGE